VPIGRALEYAVFTFWVSICAFAPELIWQGFMLLRGHFGLAQLYSALFIGALFAFFVEPLVERVKSGHWRQPHQPKHGLLFGALVSFAFGFVVVWLHEAIAAYLAGGGHGGDHDRYAALAEALEEAFQWSSVPAAVTAAWILAGTARPLAVPATVLACIWCFAVGIIYRWGWELVLTSALPCSLLAILGTRRVLRGWDSTTIPALAKIAAATAGAMVLLMLLLDLVASRIGGPSLDFYADAAFHDDLRFYLGWCLGLYVAPNPVPDRGEGGSGAPRH
jgi:hypothetical protein